MAGATGADEHMGRVGSTAGEMTVQDREAALTRAVAQGQWQRAVILVQHGVGPSQRDTTLLRAAEGDLWVIVSDVLKLGVAPDARDRVFLKAAERDLWDRMSDVLHLGVSRPARDDVFLRAVQQQQWDCAGKLLDLGVSPQKRDCVFSDVVDCGDARLSSSLITAGVSPALRDPVLRGAVEKGRVDFMVELLRRTAMTSVCAFVLDTAVSLHGWTLVFEAVKLHEELQLSAQQMDAACGAAVSDRQWDCVFFLLAHGVEATQEMVDAVLQSDSEVLERFLEIYPGTAMPSALKRMLIDSAVGLGNQNILPELLRRYVASDKEMEELFECAVRCENKEALLVLVSCANRNGQILKRLCDKKFRVLLSNTKIFTWICDTLMILKQKHILLSIDIAFATKSWNFVEDVLCNETSEKVHRMFLQKACSHSDDLFRKLADLLIFRYPHYRHTLFLMAVRHGRPYAALYLYGQGVTLRDINYALGVHFASQACVSDYVPQSRERFDCYLYFENKWSRSGGTSTTTIAQDYVRKLTKENRLKVMKGLVRRNLYYFLSTGEEEEFLFQFGIYCRSNEAETGFVVSIFRQAYKAAVAWERVKFFVDSINLVMTFSKAEQRRSARSLHRRGTEAYKEFVSVEDTSIAVAAIDFALRKQKYSFVVQTILTEITFDLNAFLLKRLFRKRAWLVFDMLFDREIKDLKSGSCLKLGTYFCRDYAYGKVFIHCLSRIVNQASNTRSVGASNAVTVGASNTVTGGATNTTTVDASNTATVGVSNTETVGVSNTETVGVSNTVTVELEASNTKTVGVSNTKTVGVSNTVTVELEASDTKTVGVSNTKTVGVSNTVTVELEASNTKTVGVSNTVTVGATDTPTVDASNTSPVGVSNTVAVGTSDTETVGVSNTVTVGASNTMTVEASDTATLGAVRALDKWLLAMCPSTSSQLRGNAGRVLTQALPSHFRLSKRPNAVLRLAEFSNRHGCQGLALFLAAVESLVVIGREVVEHVADSHFQSVSINLVFELACYAVNTLLDPWYAVSLVSSLPLSALWSPHSYMDGNMRHLCLSAGVSNQMLIEVLRDKHAHCWVLVCQLAAEDFTEAEKTLALSDAQDWVDVVLLYAVRSYRWDLVCRYVSEACRPELLRMLVNKSLEGYGNVVDAGVVRRLVTLAGTAHDGVGKETSIPYLSGVVRVLLLHRPQRALVLARCLVSLGASAQQRKVEGNSLCPLGVAGRNQKLQLVKLFHRSGVCSNHRLYQLAASSHDWYADEFIERHVGVDEAAIQSYLTFAASCPLSLQDLCRHAVSSSLGGRPGYLQRVQALPVPEPVKEFILFSDLTVEVEEKSAGQKDQ